MEGNSNHQEIGLVLQGGGALGAYELGALTRLYEVPGFRPDFVSGVSIGAITAAILVGSRDNDPLAALNRLWERFEIVFPPFIPEDFGRFASLFGNMNFYRMRLDYFDLPFWTCLYDTSPLRATLEEFVDLDKIERSGQQLIITATNIRTGRVEPFDNRKTRITYDHIIASGSLPPGFPMTRIDNKDYYWDGGLFENTPLTYIVEAFSDKPGIEKKLIVINLFPFEGKVPKNMPDVFDRTFELIFSNKLHRDVETLKKVNEYVEAITMIDAALPKNSAVRALPGFQRLLQYRLIRDVIYITNNNPEMVSAPFDFSEQSIGMRKQAGYRDADAEIERHKGLRLKAGAHS